MTTTKTLPVLISLRQAAAETGYTESELREMARTGAIRSLPQYTKNGCLHAIRFHREALAEDLGKKLVRGWLR